MKPILLALCALAAAPLAAAADGKSALRFSSETTPLYPSEKCKPIIASNEEHGGGEASLLCPALRGYEVEVSFSGWAMDVWITGPSTGWAVSGHLGGHLEWRLADGKPFAVIVEINREEAALDGNADPKHDKLAILGVNGWKIRGEVDAHAKNARKLAQDLADAAYRAQKQTKAQAQTLTQGKPSNHRK